METITDKQIIQVLAKCGLNITSDELPKIRERLLNDPGAFDGYFEYWVAQGNIPYMAFFYTYTVFYFIAGEIKYRGFEQYVRTDFYLDFHQRKQRERNDH